MKIELLVSVKGSDGSVYGRGSIFTEPFPSDIEAEKNNPLVTRVHADDVILKATGPIVIAQPDPVVRKYVADKLVESEKIPVQKEEIVEIPKKTLLKKKKL